MHTKTVIATVAVFALGAPGCGSSRPLMASELTGQANAICRHRAVEIEALQKQHPGDFRALTKAGVSVMSRAVKDLSGLKPPESERASYNRFVTIQKSYIPQLERIATGAKPTESRAEDHAHTHEVQRITQQLGLTACQ